MQKMMLMTKLALKSPLGKGPFEPIIKEGSPRVFPCKNCYRCIFSRYGASIGCMEY